MSRKSPAKEQTVYLPHSENTVNSEIFERTLFSRNFAYAKFREIKPSQNGKITLSFIDIGKFCLSCEFFTSLICLLMLFAKIKFSRKFPNLQYLRKKIILYWGLTSFFFWWVLSVSQMLVVKKI